MNQFQLFHNPIREPQGRLNCKRLFWTIELTLQPTRLLESLRNESSARTKCVDVRRSLADSILVKARQTTAATAARRQNTQPECRSSLEHTGPSFRQKHKQAEMAEPTRASQSNYKFDRVSFTSRLHASVGLAPKNSSVLNTSISKAKTNRTKSGFYRRALRRRQNFYSWCAQHQLITEESTSSPKPRSSPERQRGFSPLSPQKPTKPSLTIFKSNNQNACRLYTFLKQHS